MTEVPERANASERSEVRGGVFTDIASVGVKGEFRVPGVFPRVGGEWGGDHKICCSVSLFQLFNLESFRSGTNLLVDGPDHANTDIVTPEDKSKHAI